MLSKRGSRHHSKKASKSVIGTKKNNGSTSSGNQTIDKITESIVQMITGEIVQKTKEEVYTLNSFCEYCTNDLEHRPHVICVCECMKYCNEKCRLDDLKRHKEECGESIRKMNILCKKLPVYVKKTSTGKGWGLFAKKYFFKHERILKESYAVREIEGSISSFQNILLMTVSGNYQINPNTDDITKAEFIDNETAFFRNYRPGTNIDRTKYTKVTTVYPTGRFINHSCVPNAKKMYSGESISGDHIMLLTAACSIAHGQEITVSYSIHAYRHFQKRENDVTKAIMQSVCKCDQCIKPLESVEDSRKILYESMETLDTGSSELLETEILNVYIETRKKALLASYSAMVPCVSPYSGLSYIVMSRFKNFFSDYLEKNRGRMPHEQIKLCQQVIDDSLRYFAEYTNIFSK